MELYDPEGIPTIPAQPVTAANAAATVRIDAPSDAVRELVRALDSIIQAEQQTIYHAMRASNDTMVITITRGDYNHLRAVADRYRPVDVTSTEAERTEVDNS